MAESNPSRGKELADILQQSAAKSGPKSELIICDRAKLMEALTIYTSELERKVYDHAFNLGRADARQDTQDNQSAKTDTTTNT